MFVVPPPFPALTLRFQDFRLQLKSARKQDCRRKHFAYLIELSGLAVRLGLSTDNEHCSPLRYISFDLSRAKTTRSLRY